MTRSFAPASRRLSTIILLGALAACGGPPSDLDTEPGSEETATVEEGAKESVPLEAEDVAAGIQGGREASRETLVIVEPLRVGAVSDEIVVSARVDTRFNVQVFPKLSNLPITEVLVEEGERVAAGDMLMKLYDTDLSLAEQTARALRDEAKKERERAALTQEQDHLQVTRAERQASKAAADLARLEGLGTEGLVTRQEVDDARLTAETAQDDLDLARFSERGNKLALDLADIAVQRAEIEWLKAKTDLEESRVRSPIGGIVAERDCDVGELSSMSAPAFRVVDTDNLVLNLRVPQDAMDRIQAGQPVDVRAVTSADLDFEGVVRTVNPVLDEDSGAVRVIVDMQPAPRLVPGLFCEARIVTSSRADALLVSKRAVLYEDDQPVIFAVNGEESAMKIPFVAGVSTPTEVEVLSDIDGAPLPMDLRIIVVGQENLKDGTPVRIVEEAY